MRKEGNNQINLAKAMIIRLIILTRKKNKKEFLQINQTKAVTIMI